jgi:shikimate kinase/3-dehydroquinate synthase
MSESLDASPEESHHQPVTELVAPSRAAKIMRKLGGRSIVLVGMMGAGKTSIGKRLAAALRLPFVDADVEIENAAGMTIAEIFARHGEAYFRDGERRVIARILGDGQRVLATGGGAFMNAQTRERIADHGVSIWLKADADVLMRRVRKRPNRPLLHTRDPEQTLRNLIDERYPVYALADFCLISREGPHDMMVEAVIETLERGLDTLPRLQHESPAAMTSVASPALAPARTDATCVPVELGTRRYDILIGTDLLRHAGSEISRIAPKAACAIITDETVARHHLPTLKASLDAAGIRHASIIIKPGEASKCYETFADVCDDVIAARMERRDLIVALGGGVVGDLAGFVAATVRRGMRFVQIPTTVLSQVDSSVGGKTAINSPHGKNLIGAFYQPSLVLADTDVLATLDPREFRAGYAEVAKYGLINDAPFFAWLERHHAEVFARGPALAQAIATSCHSKASIVARDETEQGDRALLNLGHTFGHALESLTHYETARLNHGEGVAIGVACAHRFSVKLGHCAPEDARRVEAHLKAVGLPTQIRDVPHWNFSAGQILDAMYQDKKVEGGALTFILTHGIGQSFIAKGVAGESVASFLREELGT